MGVLLEPERDEEATVPGALFRTEERFSANALPAERRLRRFRLVLPLDSVVSPEMLCGAGADEAR